MTAPRNAAKVIQLAHRSVQPQAYNNVQAQDSDMEDRPKPASRRESRKAGKTRPSASSMPPPTANRLLAALPEAEFQRLVPSLEPCVLSLGQTLYELQTQLTHVYFPTDGIISLLVATQSGASGEVAVIGSEGVAGVSLFMGGRSSSRAVVQSCGHAYRLRAGYLRREFESGGFLMNVLLRYTQAFITQIAQNAVCNRHHSVEQHLCRWLLMCLDRLPGNEIRMTQEQIADMLGVRRESVTAAAGLLQSAGLIAYRRGCITVLDRPALEKRVCECYLVVKRESDRLLTLRPIS